MKRWVSILLFALITILSIAAQASPLPSSPLISLGEVVGAGVATVIIILAICFLIPVVFYLISLQKAMNSLPLDKKPFSGGLVWLTFVPIIGTVWLLIFIILASVFIKKELKSRTFSGDAGLGVAIAFIACSFVSFIFIFSKQYAAISILGLASFILWIIHWVKIARAKNSVLGSSSQIPNGIQQSASKGLDEVFCRSCGAIIKKEAEICVKCGVRQISN